MFHTLVQASVNFTVIDSRSHLQTKKIIHFFARSPLTHQHMNHKTTKSPKCHIPFTEHLQTCTIKINMRKILPPHFYTFYLHFAKSPSLPSKEGSVESSQIKPKKIPLLVTRRRLGIHLLCYIQSKHASKQYTYRSTIICHSHNVFPDMNYIMFSLANNISTSTSNHFLTQ